MFTNSLTNTDLEWIILLVRQAKGKSNDEYKTERLGFIEDRLKSMQDFSLKINITDEDLSLLREVLEQLKNALHYYESLSDISLIVEYDRIKKALSSHLETLLSLKNKFVNQSLRLENQVKKELRTRIVVDIVANGRDNNGKSISFSNAEKTLVEIDPRYVNIKNQYYDFLQVVEEIKSSYDFYSKLWQMTHQSVSTARIEKNQVEN